MRIKTLDTVLNELKEDEIVTKKIDFIKIDVEFMELNVVLGAEKLVWCDFIINVRVV